MNSLPVLLVPWRPGLGLGLAGANSDAIVDCL